MISNRSVSRNDQKDFFFSREERVDRVEVGFIFILTQSRRGAESVIPVGVLALFAWLSIKSHPKSTPNKAKSAFHPDKIRAKRTFTTRTPP